MKKVIILLVVLVFLFGCRTQQQEPTATISEKDIHVGKEGLSLKLIENAPPDEVYEGEIFLVGVEVTNKGAADTRADIFLQLDDALFLRRGDVKEVLHLDGKSLRVLEGETDVLNYQIDPTLFGGTESMPALILITARYPYQTIATSNVCVDTDPFNTRKVQKACQAKELSFSKGQGAPIALSKVEPRLNYVTESAVRPAFRVFIENVGQGELYSVSGEPNIVSITAFLAEEQLNCKDSELDLSKLDNTICELESDIPIGEPSYTTLLTVNLEYVYTNLLSREIRVKSTKVS